MIPCLRWLMEILCFWPKLASCLIEVWCFCPKQAKKDIIFHFFVDQGWLADQEFCTAGHHFWRSRPKIIRQLEKGLLCPKQIRKPCWIFSPSEGVLMVPGILNIMVTLLWQYLRYWWKEMNFSSTWITFDRLYKLYWPKSSLACWRLVY